MRDGEGSCKAADWPSSHSLRLAKAYGLAVAYLSYHSLTHCLACPSQPLCLHRDKILRGPDMDTSGVLCSWLAMPSPP